mmetsp:Transcript_2797/g.4030  ORF Transcript_2797/g.4030 Transcript_2797/m.4030 type:complete len:237 (+) Transcript_2797:100-810(+)
MRNPSKLATKNIHKLITKPFEYKQRIQTTMNEQHYYRTPKRTQQQQQQNKETKKTYEYDPKKATLYIWDFDCTITTHHTNGAQHKSLLTPTSIMNNIKHAKALKTFILKKTQENEHHHFAIATYSDDDWNKGDYYAGRTLVNTYLKCLFGDTERSFLKKEEMQCFMPPNFRVAGKNIHIDNLRCIHSQNYNVHYEPSQIWLFDDDQNNVEKAKKMGYNALNVITEEASYMEMLNIK